MAKKRMFLLLAERWLGLGVRLYREITGVSISIPGAFSKQSWR